LLIAAVIRSRVLPANGAYSRSNGECAARTILRSTLIGLLRQMSLVGSEIGIGTTPRARSGHVDCASDATSCSVLPSSWPSAKAAIYSADAFRTASRVPDGRSGGRHPPDHQAKSVAGRLPGPPAATGDRRWGDVLFISANRLLLSRPIIARPTTVRVTVAE
jgi:hypothetical protein